MRVLFISGELIAGDLAYRLTLEGCDVKLYIEDKSRKDCLYGLVKKTDDWQKELRWVGKKGLIVFDDVGYGKIQDYLRRDGYTVFGGCELGDQLEKNREFGQLLFESYGMKIEQSKDFDNAQAAIKYIKKNKAKWVVKQNMHESVFSYVGCMNDGSDVISMIQSYAKFNQGEAVRKLSLQKRVDGVEVAIARFFNGQEWTSPIFVSFEHKPFLNQDIGPLTAEMGTLAWYDTNENNKLFQATLEKIKPYLQQINYRGYVDINSIVHENKVTPLEATMRFGTPTNHMQSAMHVSGWKDLLFKTAKGENFSLQYKKGYSIVVSIAIPPFPYKSVSADYYAKDVDVFFKEKLTKEEWNSIHFEEVSMRKKRLFSRQLYIAGGNGYILYITGLGKTVQEAREKTYSLIKKIVIPKMMYRTDIGVKFLERDKKLLKKWGWM